MMDPDDGFSTFAVGALVGVVVAILLSLWVGHETHPPVSEHTKNCALYWSYTRTHVDSMQVLFRCGAPK